MKQDQETKLALDTWIKLARAFATVNKQVSKSVQTLGLTLPQFSVIEALGHLGPQKIGALCKKMLVSGGNMTLVLDNLVKNNLIERVPCPDDRRAILIKLTYKGDLLFNKVFSDHAKVIRNIFSVINQDEKKELGGLLKKLGLGIRASNHI